MSPFLLVFAPVVRYYAGKSVHKKTVIKKVKEKLAQNTELRLVLLRWNEGVFRERGMQAWLEPPSETGEVLIDVQPGVKQKDIEKMAKKQARGLQLSLCLMTRETLRWVDSSIQQILYHHNQMCRANGPHNKLQLRQVEGSLCISMARGEHKASIQRRLMHFRSSLRHRKSSPTLLPCQQRMRLTAIPPSISPNSAILL